MTETEDRKSLVLVVGAGASFEAGLPVGEKLKHQIAEALDLRYADFERRGGDERIDAAFRKLGDFNKLFETARHIKDSMPQVISIDNFIDQHRADERIAIVGKLAITRCILQAESNSPMRIDRGNIYNKIDFKTLEKTWFNAFFQLLTENCQKDDLLERFRKVAIICFNYDRCIEHYLHSSLMNVYKMTPEEAAVTMTHLEIHHPYGTVGRLPWQEGRDNGIDFGASPGTSQFIELAREIRTFTEGTDAKTSDIASIRAAVASAKRIAFLGFAFHRLNIQLLFPGPKEGQVLRPCGVFGTALNISAADISVIMDELSNFGCIDRSGIQLNNKLACAQLFGEYWRSLGIR